MVDELQRLECTVEAPSESCWMWLYDAEAESLKFASSGYEDVPEDRRPILLGRIRFPTQYGMTLEVNSIVRAIAGARFFAGRLGKDVVATRCRVVNRCFSADEGRLEKLMATLDRDVTVIDPREGEAALNNAFKDVRSPEDLERAAAEHFARKIRDKEDVPLVEDFPLVPEEETPDFQHLATALELRFIRAVEHWNGNTNLTLTSIILAAVEGRLIIGAEGSGTTN